MAAPTNEKITALLAKKAKLEAQLQRLKNRDASTERKARSRALLLLGVALEKQLQAQPGSAHMVRQIILAHLKEREQEAVASYLFPTNTNEQHLTEKNL